MQTRPPNGPQPTPTMIPLVSNLPIRDLLLIGSVLVNATIGAFVWREFLKLRRAVADLCDVVSSKRRVER